MDTTAGDEASKGRTANPSVVSPYNGSFASIVPATPGPGLTWLTTSLTTHGTLRVGGSGSAPPEIGTISVSGGNVLINGTGGTAGRAYFVLSSTNVALPLISWTPTRTNTFATGGSFSVTIAVDSSASQQFFLLQLQ